MPNSASRTVDFVIATLYDSNQEQVLAGDESAKGQLQELVMKVNGKMDFEQARLNMVNNQIRPVDVTQHKLLQAMMDVPRERFVGEAHMEIAYIDEDLALPMSGQERYLMEPAPLAKLVQLADVRDGDVVLDIGCGTGYSAAILGRLAETVVAIEEDKALFDHASSTLSDLGFDNCVVIEGVLKDGYAGEGPYDVIFLGGAVDEIPDSIFDQLKDGGRLVAVLGHGNAAKAMLYLREGEVISSRVAFNCAVLPLPGFEKSVEFQF